MDRAGRHVAGGVDWCGAGSWLGHSSDAWRGKGFWLSHVDSADRATVEQCLDRRDGPGAGQPGDLRIPLRRRQRPNAVDSHRDDLTLRISGQSDWISSRHHGRTSRRAADASVGQPIRVCAGRRRCASLAAGNSRSGWVDASVDHVAGWTSVGYCRSRTPIGSSASIRATAGACPSIPVTGASTAPPVGACRAVVPRGVSRTSRERLDSVARLDGRDRDADRRLGPARVRHGRRRDRSRARAPRSPDGRAVVSRHLGVLPRQRRRARLVRRHRRGQSDVGADGRRPAARAIGAHVGTNYLDAAQRAGRTRQRIRRTGRRGHDRGARGCVSAVHARLHVRAHRQHRRTLVSPARDAAPPVRARRDRHPRRHHRARRWPSEPTSVIART